MPERPGGEVSGNDITIVVLETPDRSAHYKVLVIQSVLAVARLRSKEPQMVGRVVASVPHPPPQKIGPLAEEEPIHPRGRPFQELTDLPHKFRRQTLIGVQVQHPVALPRQMLLGPVALGAVVLKRVGGNCCPGRLSNFYCAISAARVNDKYTTGKAAQALQASREVCLLVQGEDDDGELM
jgi:hypothetical protein